MERGNKVVLQKKEDEPEQESLIKTLKIPQVI
jgi:hypothetical protein